MKLPCLPAPRFLLLGLGIYLGLTAASSAQASGGPAGNSTGTGAVAVGGTTAAGHGGSGAVSSAGARSSTGTGGAGHSFTGSAANSGFRPASSFHAITPTYGAPRYSPDGGTVGTTQGQRLLAPAGRASLSNPGNPAFPASTKAVRSNPAPVRPNAWTDPAPARVADAGNSASAAAALARADRRNGTTYPRNFTGSVLYPGAFGYQQNNPAGIDTPYRRDNSSGLRQRGGRDPYTHFNRYGYAGLYYPYYGGFYGDAGYLPYAGSFYGADGLGDPPASGGELSPAYGSNDNDGTGYASNGAGDPNASPSDPVLPPPPAVGPRMSPGFPSPSTAPSGPDSLVEAVQNELTRRGYFGGKVDAVYGADTRAALQRFQSDQGLPTTGRINEATLHALQLD